MRPITLIVSLFQNSQLTRNLKLVNCRPIENPGAYLRRKKGCGIMMIGQAPKWIIKILRFFGECIGCKS